MSASVNDSLSVPDSSQHNAASVSKNIPTAGNGSYKGFVAGVFSGITKLSGMLEMSRSLSWSSLTQSQLAILSIRLKSACRRRNMINSEDHWTA